MAERPQQDSEPAGSGERQVTRREYVVFATSPCALALPANAIASIKRSDERAQGLPQRLEWVLGMRPPAPSDELPTRMISLAGEGDLSFLVPHELAILQATQDELLPLPRLPELEGFAALLMSGGKPHALVLHVDPLRALLEAVPSATSSPS